MLSLSLFLFLLLSVCPSTYLPVHLYLFLVPRVYPAPLAFRTFASSLNQGAHTAHRCVYTYVSTRICVRRSCVYTTRRDPSLVRSHFKHLLYHDRSLGAQPSRCDERFLLAVPRARGKDVQSSERDFDGPSTGIKGPFAVLYHRLRSFLLVCRFYVCGVRGGGLTRWRLESFRTKYDESFRILVTDKNS